MGDPLAFAFEQLHLTKFSGVIAVSAVIAMAGVLLVFQVGQPRIWMSMSRDGLLPKAFSGVHRRFRTPWFATIITGILVAIPSLFMNLTEVTDLCSIGTLFAFVLVSGGVLILDRRSGQPETGFARGFRVPYLNSRYWLPAVWAAVFVTLWLTDTAFGIRNPVPGILNSKGFPMMVFAVVAVVLTVAAVWRKLSLIPVLGLLTNLYLMAHLGVTNWLRFGIWLLIGLTIYFLYGIRKSKLNRTTRQTN